MEDEYESKFMVRFYSVVGALLMTAVIFSLFARYMFDITK